MSIETEFESTITNVKNAYQGLDNLGATIPQNKTIENIKSCLDEIYNNLPKTEYQEGTEVTIENGLKGKLDFENGVVGKGDTEQDSTQGLQLYPIKNIAETTENGITYSIKDGIMSINGTATSSFNVSIVGSYGTSGMSLTAGSYTWGYYNVSGSYTGVFGKYLRPTGTGTAIWDGNLVDYLSTKTLEQDYNSLYSVLYIGNGASFNNLKFKLMICKGTYTAQTIPTWEKYTGGQASPNPSYPQQIKSVTGNQDVVVSGKNLFEPVLIIDGTSINKHYCTMSITNQVFKFVSTGGDMFFGDVTPANSTYNKGKGIKIYKNGNTKLSFKMSNNLINKNFISAYNSDDVSLGYSATLTEEGTYTFPENCEYVTFRIGRENTTSGDEFETTIMVAYGDTIPDYEPYITPTSYQLSLGDIELCKIGTYQDYIYKSGDKWYVHKEIGNNRLTSTNQEWNMIDTSISNKKRYSTSGFSNLIKRPSSTSVVGDILCSHYISQEATTTGSFGGHQGISVSPDGQVFVNDDNYLNDFAGWKTWLDSVFCEFYYALATSTNTEITDTTLINQLNAWYNAHSLNGTTIITSNGNLPMIIKCRGLKGE